MKFSEIRAGYIRHTTALSAQSRQLALAGIAIVWILGPRSHAWKDFSNELSIALFLFALGMLADLLQYAVLALGWQLEKNHANHLIPDDHQNPDDFEVDVNPAANSVGIFFFWAKVAVLLLGYVFVLIAFVRS